MNNDNSNIKSPADHVLSHKFMWFNRFEQFAEEGEPIESTLKRLQECFTRDSVPSKHWFIGLFKELLTDEYMFQKEMEWDTCQYCPFWEDDEPEIEKINVYLDQKPRQKRNFLFTDEFYNWLYDLVRNSDLICSDQTIVEFRQKHEKNHDAWEECRMRERQLKFSKRLKLIASETCKLSLSDRVLWFERFYDFAGNNNLVEVVKRLHEQFPKTEVPSEDWFRMIIKEYLSDASINNYFDENGNYILPKTQNEENNSLSEMGSFLTSEYKNYGKILPMYSDAFTAWAYEVSKDTPNEEFIQWMIGFRDRVGKTNEEIEDEQKRKHEILKEKLRVQTEQKAAQNREAIDDLPF